MSINQAHVEAICSATYLQNYLDCLDALPDDLQRILTQIREVDVQLSVLEIDSTAFEEMFTSLKEGEEPDSSTVSQLHNRLLRMQEFEDEKIQLSSSLMEYIDNRAKQLESDRENLDPTNHIANDGATPKSNNSYSKRNSSNDTKAIHSSASAHSIDSSRESSRQGEHRVSTNSAKKRKPKVESPAVTTKSSSLNSKASLTTSNSGSLNSKDSKEETPAKKHSTLSASQEEVKSASKIAPKRKRRSKAGTQAKNQKEVAMEPIESEEPTYCICDQVSYGEMIGCDNDACPIEWFHFNCVHLNNKPKGKWFCPKCRGDKQTVMRRGADKGR